MNEEDYKQLEEAIAFEIATAINNTSLELFSAISEVQPTTAVITAAANAATAVLIAWERGTNLGQ